MALITAVDKYARDSLSGFMLQGFTLQKVDALAVLSFFLCFVLSVVCVPFEDRVFYANKRVPSWWEYESATSSFKSSVATYMGTNFARCFFALLGWACVCYTNTPQVIDVLDRAEEMKTRPGGDGGRVSRCRRSNGAKERRRGRGEGGRDPAARVERRERGRGERRGRRPAAAHGRLRAIGRDGPGCNEALGTIVTRRQ